MAEKPNITFLNNAVDYTIKRIKEAEEKFPESGSGDKKKAYVIEKVKAKCDELGIPYALLKKLINVAIDKVIEDYNVISK